MRGWLLFLLQMVCFAARGRYLCLPIHCITKILLFISDAALVNLIRSETLFLERLTINAKLHIFFSGYTLYKTGLWEFIEGANA